jgi:phage baseplate assembly protein W
MADSSLSRDPLLGAGWAFPVTPHKGEPTAPIAMARGEESVRQAIEIILFTSKGERVMRPDFGCGLGRLAFAPNNGTTRALAAFEVSEALKAWEPRIEVLEVQVTPGDEPSEMLIDVAYRVRTTDNRFNFVFPYYLDRALA